MPFSLCKLTAMRALLCVALSTVGSLQSVRAQTPLPQTCQLGDLKLESGEVIKDFKMTYMTFGTLNADKSNAILSIHGLQGNRNSQSAWVRPGGAFDTN